ncbi:MAG: UDP-N-acetylmuramate dehydrogenase [Oscillospiraceae bacterium]
MNERVCRLAKELDCKVLYNEPLKKYTTFKVGGECSCIIKPKSAADCGRLAAELKKEGEPFFVLGKGSNVIADDGGYKGTVLLIGEDMSEISVNGNIITAGAGAPLISVCKKALENSLTGLEFAYGIPGTVGGGVYMNAGAYGGEIKDILKFAEAVDRETFEVRRFTAEEAQLSYRKSIFMENGYIITSAVFELSDGDSAEIKTKMNELMEKRISKQPLDFPSAGSTFKRPEGSFASLLIEQCGLKGLSVGGAQVSTKHSGFVINTGNATSADIFALIEKVKEIVFEKTGYRLECEPVILK